MLRIDGHSFRLQLWRPFLSSKGMKFYWLRCCNIAELVLKFCFWTLITWFYFITKGPWICTLCLKIFDIALNILEWYLIRMNPWVWGSLSPLNVWQKVQIPPDLYPTLVTHRQWQEGMFHHWKSQAAFAHLEIAVGILQLSGLMTGSKSCTFLSDFIARTHSLVPISI